MQEHEAKRKQSRNTNKEERRKNMTLILTNIDKSLRRNEKTTKEQRGNETKLDNSTNSADRKKLKGCNDGVSLSETKR